MVVTGASGFLGRASVRQLAADSFIVRAAIRGEARACTSQEKIRADVADVESLRLACQDCSFGIHLVGIIQEKGDATFEKVIADGTRNFATACNETGVKKLVYISALGTGANATSKYFQAKFHAEQSVINSGVPYVIFRPSVIVGPGDDFVNRFAGNFSPLPDNGASKFQPVYVGDVAKFISRALTNPAVGTFEIGGPDVLTLRQMIETAETVKGKKAMHPSIPLGLAKVGAKLVFDPLIKLGFAMPAGSDALVMLETPNVCSPGELERSVDTFGVPLTPYARAVIE